MSDKTGCAWSRTYQNATSEVNVCTKHLFARISWVAAGDVGGAPSLVSVPSPDEALPVPPLRNVEVSEAPLAGGGECARGAARVRAPWAASGFACLEWKASRRGQRLR